MFELYNNTAVCHGHCHGFDAAAKPCSRGPIVEKGRQQESGETQVFSSVEAKHTVE